MDILYELKVLEINSYITNSLYSKSPEKKMKNRFLKSNIGFTLIELVVAITISVMIMGGVLGFLTKLQSDIVTSKQSTRVYTNLTDFMGVMRNFGKLYESGSVIVGGSGAYNAGLLIRPDQTSGVLIGVVEEKSGNLSKLDQNKDIYGKKVIAYQKLTASQIDSILVSTGSIYTVNFADEGLFRELTVTDLSITSYNSGSLFEYRGDIEFPFYEALIGKKRTDISPNVTSFSFTLDF